MLLVGGAGQDSGKTLLACSIIARFAGEAPIVAVKMRPKGASGVALPPGTVELREETAATPGHDTGRMLLAGARRALLVLAHHDSYPQALAAVRRETGEGAIAVFESTGLRAFAVPDLFLIVRRAGAGELKPSAGEHLGLADRVVTFDGERFDLSPDELCLEGGLWRLR